ncbi:carboxy-terminal domain RNA polymerase II polypeptide A small phosphatase, putative [Entamoeba invadens IP1]|uniref:Mitochondrial import inner membrane translocase subunit TIM50 n=1 Tax=Entamoeba invadens IP1 TaxID=370355 RepID=A0A0A1U463_ENTIV|nr:carboxy-terminal domain RNA polymerase II polypeptide A small phosphatase, putative [Entamoeba invadens IP1]ELP86476.1 carboxy-terminal domain RNA polymerase II polypeptide A small phosphatase, putative [Entamoeba invadens IP1]|eukprot:XP_004185822.1 carboxy-terminal domain RNA polymerase II polypeptide A small phosphatase, putative [Entamoeba invadens IP1]
MSAVVRKLTRSPTVNHLGGGSDAFVFKIDYTPKLTETLLPPKDDERLTVIFDLDETLIHTHSLLPEDSKHSRETCKVVVQNKEYTTSIRPGAIQFLRQLSKTCEVVLFTASKQVYADQIIDYMEKDGKIFEHKLYQQSCKNKFGRVYKDATKLGRDIKNVVIFDDCELVWTMTQDKLVVCKRYEGGQDDNEIDNMQKHLDKVINERLTTSCFF